MFGLDVRDGVARGNHGSAVDGGRHRGGVCSGFD
jgi:hypothetical protein